MCIFGQESDGGSTIHQTFQQNFNGGFFSLGFAKNKDGKMRYMKPGSDKKRIKITDSEHYCFQVPEVSISLKSDWHLAIEEQIELDGK